MSLRDKVDTGEVALVRVDDLKPGPKVRSHRLDEDNRDRLIPVLDECPPIHVAWPSMEIVDGHHRVAAAKIDRRSGIRAVLRTLTREEAHEQAYEMNRDHGLPLSLDDRRTEAKRRLKLDGSWSDRRIGEKAGLDHKTVGTLRAEMEGRGEIPHVSERTDSKGRSQPASKAPKPESDTEHGDAGSGEDHDSGQEPDVADDGGGPVPPAAGSSPVAAAQKAVDAFEERHPEMVFDANAEKALGKALDLTLLDASDFAAYVLRQPSQDQAEIVDRLTRLAAFTDDVLEIADTATKLRSVK